MVKANANKQFGNNKGGQKPMSTEKTLQDGNLALNPEPKEEKVIKEPENINDHALFNEQEFLANRKLMNKKSLDKTVREILQLRKDKKLGFENAIQRKYVWQLENKSMLIHSLIVNYPMPQVYSTTSEGVEFDMLDGKQRLSSIIDYCNDGYSLYSLTPAVYSYEVRGKLFTQLPKAIQNAILDYKVNFQHITDATDSTISEMFLNFQRGVQLTPFEKTRVGLTGLNGLLEEICSMPLFDKVALSEKQKNRFESHQLIIQCMMILDGHKTDLSAVNTRSYADGIKDGARPEMANNMRAITKYLNEVAEMLTKDQRQKLLKKSHLPVLYALVDLSMPVKIFYEKIMAWLADVPADYSKSAGAGSTKASNIKTRLRLMAEAFHMKANTTTIENDHMNEAQKEDIVEPKQLEDSAKTEGENFLQEEKPPVQQ